MKKFTTCIKWNHEGCTVFTILFSDIDEGDRIEL